MHCYSYILSRTIIHFNNDFRRRTTIYCTLYCVSPWMLNSRTNKRCLFKSTIKCKCYCIALFRNNC